MLACRRTSCRKCAAAAGDSRQQQQRGGLPSPARLLTSSSSSASPSCDKKLLELGWSEKTPWEEGLKKTVDWCGARARVPASWRCCSSQACTPRAAAPHLVPPPSALSQPLPLCRYLKHAKRDYWTHGDMELALDAHPTLQVRSGGRPRPHPRLTACSALPASLLACPCGHACRRAAHAMPRGGSRAVPLPHWLNAPRSPPCAGALLWLHLPGHLPHPLSTDRRTAAHVAAGSAASCSCLPAPAARRTHRLQGGCTGPRTTDHHL